MIIDPDRTATVAVDDLAAAYCVVERFAEERGSSTRSYFQQTQSGEADFLSTIDLGAAEIAVLPSLAERLDERPNVDVRLYLEEEAAQGQFNKVVDDLIESLGRPADSVCIRST